MLYYLPGHHSHNNDFIMQTPDNRIVSDTFLLERDPPLQDLRGLRQPSCFGDLQRSHPLDRFSGVHVGTLLDKILDNISVVPGSASSGLCRDGPVPSIFRVAPSSC